MASTLFSLSPYPKKSPSLRYWKMRKSDLGKENRWDCYAKHIQFTWHAVDCVQWGRRRTFFYRVRGCYEQGKNIQILQLSVLISPVLHPASNRTCFRSNFLTLEPHSDGRCKQYSTCLLPPPCAKLWETQKAEWFIFWNCLAWTCICLRRVSSFRSVVILGRCCCRVSDFKLRSGEKQVWS